MLRPTTGSPNAHFLAGELPAGADIRSRWLSGTALSLAIHLVGLGALLYTATHAAQVAKIVNEAANRALIFLPENGLEPSGGARPGPSEPPQPAQIVVTKPIDAITPTPKPADVPTPDIIVSMQTPQASQTIPGTLSALTVPGTGTTGGGTGTGIDGGRGSGVGPGDGANHGDGPMQIGNGVTSPVLIHEVRPSYTADAMRAKLQGAVEMQAVVRTDGTIDPKSVRITRSLDSTFGLDDQAMSAVRQWRFRPGTLRGQAVAVVVNVELTFTLR